MTYLQEGFGNKSGSDSGRWPLLLMTLTGRWQSTERGARQGETLFVWACGCLLAFVCVCPEQGKERKIIM